MEVSNYPISKKWSPRQQCEKYSLIVRQHTPVEEPQVEGDDAVAANLPCFLQSQGINPVGTLLLQVGVQLQRRQKLAWLGQAHKNTNISFPNDSEGLSILLSCGSQEIKRMV